MQFENGKGLIIVGGCPRSGTTLVQALLTAYPAIHGEREFGWLPRIVELHREIGNDSERIAAYCSRADIDAARAPDPLLHDESVWHTDEELDGPLTETLGKWRHRLSAWQLGYLRHALGSNPDVQRLGYDLSPHGGSRIDRLAGNVLYALIERRGRCRARLRRMRQLASRALDRFL